MASFELDARTVEKLIGTVQEFTQGDVAEDTINQYLAGEGGDILKQSIQQLLPASGRSWKGKKAAATATDPFNKTPGNLNVRIHTKGSHHYLYFPDDGSDTIKHYGNQMFMKRGAEERQEEIGDNIINRLIKRLEEQ